ncbi:hypothetical protein [Acuticoccus sp. I52.16.1]|uniref:hypothetical protein n=1 Tax=Acuticoccus sp. I52.16.1 TaxID=2928472 RepID=UPI001FD2E50C|nr:hypothetical protein [Acuticoccus sp. I52.16.1]UOM34010.1 hypothetical protein MRB58_19575 [Acuticoccus sp. I52.16.1]
MRHSSGLFLLCALTLLAGCAELSKGEPTTWYAAHGGVAPREMGRVVVCHGFGCHRKTAFTFGPADIARMKKLVGNGSAEDERAGVRRMIAWAETRVAPTVGSEDDVGGLDLRNSGVVGQMDCIDEATNTTSYLMVAQEAGLLKHHRVGSPVSRGYFLDLRYPHATAVLLGEDEAWAIDSWPAANGVPPDVMPLDTWFAQSPARP